MHTSADVKFSPIGEGGNALVISDVMTKGVTRCHVVRLSLTQPACSCREQEAFDGGVVCESVNQVLPFANGRLSI